MENIAPPSLTDNDSSALGTDEDKVALLRRLPCFADAPAADLMAIAATSAIVSYEAGDTVISPGQWDATFLLGIVEGSVRLTRGLAEAGDIDVFSIGSGTALGLIELLSGQAGGDPSLSIVAENDVTALVIEQTGIAERSRSSLGLARTLVIYLAGCLSPSMQANKLLVGPDRRVYRYLLGLVEQVGTRHIIPEMPKHAQIAEASGVTPEHAAEAVARLLGQNIAIRTYPALEIEKLERLQQLSV